jgi:hypothetical protein
MNHNRPGWLPQLPALLVAGLLGAGLAWIVLAQPPANHPSPSAPPINTPTNPPIAIVSTGTPSGPVVPTPMPSPATAEVVRATSEPAHGSFRETYDGQPTHPHPWNRSNWDVTIHSRDIDTFDTLEQMQALHGADCAGPPATHPVAAYDQAVFLCRDHLMTAINAQGYGVIYLTPNQLVDFSGSEAVIRFDLSTLRMSQRDWVDLWVTPYHDQLQLPLERWLPDLNGEPRNALHIRMDTFDNQTIFKATIVRDFVTTELPLATTEGYEQVLTPDAKRRDTFELRISRSHLRFGMPDYHLTWIDSDMPDLGWSQAVVQFGHHSYNPTKDCPSCLPNTWHWDNITITPARPFTIIAAGHRPVSAATSTLIEFPQPAPADAHLRFAGIGTNLEVSFDNGVSWQPAQRQAQLGSAEDHFASYWMPMPQGATSVRLRGNDWWGGAWRVRDASIWASDH